MRVTDGWIARWPDSDVVSVRTDHYGKPAYEAPADPDVVSVRTDHYGKPAYEAPADPDVVSVRTDPDVADVGPVAHERSDGIGPDARRGG
jgi:hypothetical protein